MISSSRPMPPSVQAEIERLEAMREELSRRGWPARILCRRVSGERDVRLQVGALRALVVELLGPFGDEHHCGDRWQAVAVTPRSRVVWGGPRRESTPDAVLQFVEDLLRHDVAELTERYDFLG